jgi:Undecaprenyl-phosphate galactose phosphotransferase WbaP
MTLSEFELWYRGRFGGTSSAFTTTAMVIADLIGVMVSFGAGFFFINLYDMGLINFKSFVTYWPYLLVFILIFQVQSLYPGVSLAPSEELRHFCIGSFFAHGGIVLSRYIEDRDFDAITAAFFISFLVSTFILLLGRSTMRRILGLTRRGGIPAVVYGSGDVARKLIDKLLDKRWIGYMPVLILDEDSDSVGENTPSAYREIPIIHDLYAGPEIVSRLNIKIAIVAMPHIAQEKLARLLNHSVAAFRYHVIIPGFVGITNIMMSVRDFDGLLGFATTQRLKMKSNLAIKRCIDITIIIIGGMVILPFLLLIALIVKLTSKGPVLYGHTRIGQGGRHYKVYKFRSMAIDADQKLQTLLDSDSSIKKEWEDSHKIKDDPRVTPFGKFLRATSLDEFPQILNVLKGDMSLVGPRPVVDEEIKKYGEDFARIFSVRPGITGLWQVSGRSDTDYSDRVAFDTYYLQSWSIWLDIWVLYKTFGAVLNKKGAY